jgi:hypothetical protein
MIALQKVIEMRVCFRNSPKNTNILIDTTDVQEARRIARLWGERTEGEPVTRTIYRGQIAPYDVETMMIEGIKVWPPLF